MNKEVYVAYFPETGETQRVKCNPAHLNQLCILLLNGKKIVCIKRQINDSDFYETILIAILENGDYKFWKKSSQI